MTNIIQTLKTALTDLTPAGQPGTAFELFFHVNPVSADLQINELLTCTGHNPYTPVTIYQFAEFYKICTTPAVPTFPAALLQKLQNTLEQSLTNLKMYRINSDPGQTYIIGEDQDGNFAGLKLLP